MSNESYHRAKNVKNDEFYTQFPDIEKEMNAYIDYNKDVFRDKIILLPCDDPEWSNFTRWFVLKFIELGIKKLISTSYAPAMKNLKDWQPSLFERRNPVFDLDKSRTKGRLFILSKESSAQIDIDNLPYTYMKGDGDFRSDEVKKLRDEADFIITNPPFSLFREFVVWLMESHKKFSIIGNTGVRSNKEFFPLLMDNLVWVGATGNTTDMVFRVPEGTAINPKDKMKAEKLGYKGNYTRQGNSCWYTNIEHGKRITPLALMTMNDNIRYNQKKIPNGYEKYVNYNAIEIPRIDLIPSDYKGIMGVPVTFFDSYCPEQFEIMGCTQRGCHQKVPDTMKFNEYKEMKSDDDTPTGSSGSKTNENANMTGKGKTKNYFKNDNGDMVHSLSSRIFIKLK